MLIGNRSVCLRRIKCSRQYQYDGADTTCPVLKSSFSQHRRQVRTFSEQFGLCKSQNDGSLSEHSGFPARSGNRATVLRSTIYPSRRHYSSPPADIWPITSHGHPKALRSARPSLRNCVITGGTSGIGYQIAKQLINDGANTIRLISRDVGRATRAIESLKRETGYDDAPVGIIEGDLRSVSSIVAQWTKYHNHVKGDQHLAIDTLINCAGLTQNQLLQRSSSEDITEILNVNLQAPIELSKAFLNGYQSLALHRRKSGTTSQPSDPSFCVVNVSSLLGSQFGLPGTSVYAASKAGLTAFTRSLTMEGAALWSRYKDVVPPFRANVIIPGYIDTPMTSDFSDTQKAELMSRIPLHRFGTAEEVAEAVMLLIRNEYANNCTLNLDGGLSAS